MSNFIAIYCLIGGLITFVLSGGEYLGAAISCLFVALGFLAIFIDKKFEELKGIINEK